MSSRQSTARSAATTAPAQATTTDSESDLSDLSDEAEGAQYDVETSPASSQRSSGSVMPDFLEKVYAVCHRIPLGKVTSYGHIAMLAGYPRYSRHVGNAMRDLPANSQVPWHRVISSAGYISPRASSNGLAVQRQRERLEAEGVVVTTQVGGGVHLGPVGGGKEKIDLKVFGWFPGWL